MTDAALTPKLVGARVKRLEDPRLLAGRGSYVDDRQVPGMVHVAFRRSELAHARIVRVDVARARALPGVIGVYTMETLEGLARPAIATSKMRDYRPTAM